MDSPTSHPALLLKSRLALHPGSCSELNATPFRDEFLVLKVRPGSPSSELTQVFTQPPPLPTPHPGPKRRLVCSCSFVGSWLERKMWTTAPSACKMEALSERQPTSLAMSHRNIYLYSTIRIIRIRLPLLLKEACRCPRSKSDKPQAL